MFVWCDADGTRKTLTQDWRFGALVVCVQFRFWFWRCHILYLVHFLQAHAFHRKTWTVFVCSFLFYCMIFILFRWVWFTSTVCLSSFRWVFSVAWMFHGIYLLDDAFSFTLSLWLSFSLLFVHFPSFSLLILVFFPLTVPVC